jgi:hypothetical protein
MPIPIGATTQYNNYAQLNYPPFENILWVTYNAPDPTGASSNFPNQLINYFYTSSQIGLPNEYNVPTSPAGGDLSGFYPNPMVVGIDGYAISSGSLPANGTSLQYSSVDGKLHWLASGSGFAAGGDLSGTNLSQTVTGIQGIPISATAPAAGQFLEFNGANYVPTTFPGSLPPSGGAGGDLSGNYPNPTVVKIDGATVPTAGSLTTGNVLQVTGASALSYAPINLSGGIDYLTGLLPAANQAFQALLGDVTGTTAASTVVKIQGNPILAQSLGSAQDGYVLSWNNAAGKWEAQLVASGSVVLGGDVTGSSSANTVMGINGVPIVITSLASNQLLVYNGVDYVNQKISDGQISASAAIAGTKIAPNFGSQNVLTTGTLGAGATTVSSLKDTALSTGVLHSDGSGNVTSSLVVNADVSSSAAIAVSKLAAGTNGYVLETVAGIPTWSNFTSSGVTWANDLSGNATTTNTHQYVSSLSYSSSAAGGPISINGTGTTLVFAANNTAPAINVSSTTNTTAYNLQINGQQTSSNATSASGGNIYIEAGYSTGSGTATSGGTVELVGGQGSGAGGSVILQGGVGSGAIGFGGSIDLVAGLGNTNGVIQTINEAYVQIGSLGGSGSGFVAVNNSGKLSWSAGPSGSFSAGGDLSGTSSSQTVVGIEGKPIVLTSLSTGQVLQYNGTDWVNVTPSSGVTWANDLVNSTNTHQYVSSLSYSSSAGGGTIAINGTGTTLQFAGNNTAPAISQANPASGAGATLSINAQASGGGVAAGGAITLNAGNSGGGAGGALNFNSGVGGTVNGDIVLNTGSNPTLTLSGTTSGNLAFGNSTVPNIFQTALGSTAGAGTAGAIWTMTGQAGQASTGSTGGNGALMIIQAGAGGAGDTIGGTGGTLTLEAGAAGPGSTTGAPGNIMLVASAGATYYGIVEAKLGSNLGMSIGDAGFRLGAANVITFTTGTSTPQTLTHIQYQYGYIVIEGIIQFDAIIDIVFPATDGATWIVDLSTLNFNSGGEITFSANGNTWGTIISAQAVYRMTYIASSGMLWGDVLTK